MDKNTVIGLVLIAVVLIGFSFYSTNTQKQQAAQPAPQENLSQAQEKNAARQDADRAAAALDSTALFHEALTGKNEKIVLKNNKVTVTINSKGGTVSEVRLNEYRGYADYKEGREYLYASLRGLGKGRFSYALSLGLDIVERSSAGARKNYVNVLPSLTLAYETHKGGTLRLAYNRQRVSPSLSYLNPLNTSTDSLYVIEGNPYLAPELSECVTLSYAWNKSPVYLQPSVSYTYARDRVLAVGSLRGDIYTRSYLNAGHAHDWRFALTARVNLGKYGNINVTPYFRKQDLPGMAFSGESWGMSGNVYLAYKKLWLNGMFNYTSYNYGSVVRTHSTPMSRLMRAILRVRSARSGLNSAA